MPHKNIALRWKWLIIAVIFIMLCAGILAAIFLYNDGKYKGVSVPPRDAAEPYTAWTYAMSTIINQTVYGPGAETAAQQVNQTLAEWETRLSLYLEGSDISRINAAAGKSEVSVSPETAELLLVGLALSRKSEGAFALTIAPVTLAWGIAGETPRVVPSEELSRLLPLVDDAAVQIEGDRVFLPRAGMGIDLGGIAKGGVCSALRRVYNENGIKSALISIGGNVYAHGSHPDGKPFSIGFREPAEGAEGYIASFALSDAVVAVSGGYERFFEKDGKRYIHIIDPRTGLPVESDIASVGVIHADGATADFYSTTLYVWGAERALEYMRNGGCAILLDMDNRLYVSESLREGFALHDTAASTYTVEFVPGG